MVSPRKTPVTAFSVPVWVRNVINRSALNLSVELGERTSMATVVAINAYCALMHPDTQRAAARMSPDELRVALSPADPPEVD